MPGKKQLHLQAPAAAMRAVPDFSRDSDMCRHAPAVLEARGSGQRLGGEVLDLAVGRWRLLERFP